MEKKIELFQLLTKTEKGFRATLSDTSVDRDGEVVGEEALSKAFKSKEDCTPILVNHENKIENLIGEWTEKQLIKVNGHTALVATPKFYLSNPKAQLIKGLLDDGAECGISIGAIVNKSETRKINGVDTKVFTDIELLEASFVAIPSNRHGKAVAIAKSFEPTGDNMKKDHEEPAVEEPVAEVVADEPVVAEPVEGPVEEDKSFELAKKLDESTKAFDDLTKQLEVKEAAYKELEVKLTESTSEVDRLSKLEVIKAKFEEEAQAETPEAAKIQDGQIPVLRK